MTSAELVAAAIIRMGRDRVAQAVELAMMRAETWRAALAPRPGEPWEQDRSRDLDVADDVIARLHELAIELGAAP